MTGARAHREMLRARKEKAQLVSIDDKNAIDACKVLGIAFTTAVGILIRSREKGLLEGADAIAKLALLAKAGRFIVIAAFQILVFALRVHGST